MPGNSNAAEQAVKALNETPRASQKLKRANFDLSNAVANQRSKIAEYKAELPLAVRQAPMRLMFVTHESFTTDGTAGNTETFSLANNLIDTSNTTDLVLYEGAARVQPDSIDHAADSFDYTDDGTSNTLHAYYVPRDPVQVEVEKQAPAGQGNIGEVIYDDATSVLHERNQHKEPPTPSFAASPLQGVVPKDWTIEVYADGPVALEWDEDTDGTAATNAILTIPINRYESNVQGLGRAVKQDILDRV